MCPTYMSTTSLVISCSVVLVSSGRVCQRWRAEPRLSGMAYRSHRNYTTLDAQSGSVLGKSCLNLVASHTSMCFDFLYSKVVKGSPHGFQLCITKSQAAQSVPTKAEADRNILEKFVVTMYDKHSNTNKVDESRLHLFARKRRSHDPLLSV